MSGIAKEDTYESGITCTLFIQFPLDRGLFSGFDDSLQENRGYVFLSSGNDFKRYFGVLGSG